MSKSPWSPGWFTALMAFLLTVGTAAPWFASVLALTAPAVYADAAESLPEDDGAPAAETGQKLIALTVIAAMSGFLLTGCGTSSDTDSQTSGSSSGITIFNSKMEIQDLHLNK